MSYSGARGHGCGLKTDRTAWCFGANEFGQLGVGTNINSLSAVRVTGSWKWSTIVTGRIHTCGVRSDRTAWCWGENNYGQLGDGTTNRRINPAAVVGDAKRRWRDICAGVYHTCGISTDGRAWCWGGHDRGQLGDGSAKSEHRREGTPVSVSDRVGLQDVRFESIACSWKNTCALMANGTAFCWGALTYAPAGLFGAAAETNVPIEMPGRWRELSAGSPHVCGVKHDDSVWCWGDNDTGQLGDGSFIASKLPRAVAGIWVSHSESTLMFLAATVSLIVAGVLALRHLAPRPVCLVVPTSDSTTSADSETEVNAGIATSSTAPRRRTGRAANRLRVGNARNRDIDAHRINNDERALQAALDAFGAKITNTFDESVARGRANPNYGDIHVIVAVYAGVRTLLLCLPRLVKPSCDIFWAAGHDTFQAFGHQISRALGGHVGDHLSGINDQLSDLVSHVASIARNLERCESSCRDRLNAVAPPVRQLRRRRLSTLF